MREIGRQILIWVGRALLFAGAIAIAISGISAHRTFILGVSLTRIGILALVVGSIFGYGIMWLSAGVIKNTEWQGRASRIRWTGLAIGISSALWLFIIEQVFGRFESVDPLLAYLPAALLLTIGVGLVIYPTLITIWRSRSSIGSLN